MGYQLIPASYDGGPNAGGASADSSQASAIPRSPTPTATFTPIATATPTATPSATGHADTHAHAHPHGDSHSDRDQHADTLADADRHADEHADADTHAHSHAQRTVTRTPTAISTATPTPPPPTATPQALPAPPSALEARQAGQQKLKLTWIQSPTPGITQNGIYRRISGGSYPPTPTVMIIPATTYQDPGLVSGTTYCYVVSAFSGSLESAKSNESCATAR